MSKFNNKYDNIDSYVIKSAYFYSRKLIRNNLYSYYDVEDLIQDFVLYYLRYKDSFDVTKSSFKSFITLIFSRFYKDIFNRAKGNHSGYTYSLEEKEDLPAGESSFFMSFDFIELNNTINKLPSNDLKNICNLILDGYTIIEIANKLNYSRKTIYKKLKIIKEYFK